jgi:hypothetical protein
MLRSRNCTSLVQRPICGRGNQEHGRPAMAYATESRLVFRSMNKRILRAIDFPGGWLEIPDYQSLRRDRNSLPFRVSNLGGS